MTSTQTFGVLIAAIILIAAGVAVVFGPGHALIAAGVLLAIWTLLLYDPDLSSHGDPSDVDDGDA